MNYYLKRVWQAFFTLFAAVSITFALYRLIPGGPVETMRNQLIQDQMEGGGQVDVEHVNHLVELHTGINPDQPIYVSYFEYMVDIVVHQDFGQSIYHNDPVITILLLALPWTVFVSIYGLVLGWSANLILGSLMAYYEGSRFDSGSTILATFLNSVPYYVGGILMLSWFAFGLGWFPYGGRYPGETTPGLNVPFMVGVVKHATLPILSGFIVGFGGAALEMRGNSIRVMGEEYIRVAHLRGLSDNRIAIRYVGRNAILPLYTAFMIGISAIFSGSIIMEQIFQYPGLGWYTFDALNFRDYPLLMGILILLSAVTVLGVLIADLTYSLIDPRAKTADREQY